VVALTANALVGDAQLCLDSGMDAHLAKPYTRQQLRGVLVRWLPSALVEATGTPAEGTAATAKADSRSTLLDQAALDNIRAIDDDGSVLDEVIQMFLDEVPVQTGALHAALAAGDLPALGATAHAMKSASFNVGAKALGELCRRLEKQAKAAETAGLPELVGAIDSMVDTVQPLLRGQMRDARHDGGGGGSDERRLATTTDREGCA
jgi:HPt (histidine-containing phosphotransfer) domain-containing protein